MDHSTTGLTLDRTTTEDGMILLVTGESKIEIGPLEDITTIHGETKADPNGVDIDIELLVNNMALTEKQSTNIKMKSPTRKKDTDLLSPRLNAYHGILLNYFDGNIKKEVTGKKGTIE